MSDAVRNWSGSGGIRRKTRRQRLRLFRNALLLVFVPLFLWLWWTTRDSWDMARLIPANQTYQLYANDFLNNRGNMARSRVWELLPENGNLSEARHQMLNNFGMPEWILNNVVHGLSHLSGNDLDQFSDVLFITTMTRVGVLLEKLHRFVPEIEREWAGGLELRIIPDLGLWYAVRGRVLLMTPDRNTLVRALTLAEEDTVGNAALASGRDALRAGEDVFGRIELQQGDPWSDTLEALELKVWLEENAFRLACQGALSPTWREWLLPLLEDASPQPLHAPPTGIIEISGNFGKPLPKLWEALPQILELEEALPTPATWLRDMQPEDGPDLATLLAELMLRTGDGWRLSFTGIDPLAFIPMPNFAASLDVEAAAVEEMLGFAAMNGSDLGITVNEATGFLHVPFIGGPSLEPGLGLRGPHLLLGTSREAAETLAAQPPPRATLTENGTLFARVRPEALVEHIAMAGDEFAAVGALRGHTPQTWAETVAYWSERATAIEDITALLAHENGIIRFEMNLFMRPEPAPPAETPETAAN